MVRPVTSSMRQRDPPSRPPQTMYSPDTRVASQGQGAMLALTAVPGYPALKAYGFLPTGNATGPGWCDLSGLVSAPVSEPVPCAPSAVRPSRLLR
jgi:hypothetical protein